jgi:hypothetical protein
METIDPRNFHSKYQSQENPNTQKNNGKKRAHGGEEKKTAMHEKTVRKGAFSSQFSPKKLGKRETCIAKK